MACMGLEGSSSNPVDRVLYVEGNFKLNPSVYWEPVEVRQSAAG